VKIVTLNIFSDLSRWVSRRDWLVQELAAQAADVIALQEVVLPENNAAWLADRLGMPYIFLTPKTGGASRKEGIALLSRLPFAAQAALDLLTQGRVAQYVLVQDGDRRWVVANGHFYWQPGESVEREEQVRRLVAWLDGLGGDVPVVVCGDFNGTPDTVAIQLMRERFVSAFATIHVSEPDYTTPTPLPRSRIGLFRTGIRYLFTVRLSDFRRGWRGTLDYIFVNQYVRVVDCQVVLNRPAPADPSIYPSDHFALAATLEYKD
jgi:endonuclease/exonuclease/phosphatase family metal-dependent hydrolase